MKAEIENENPYTAAREAAYAYAVYTGGPITARDEDGVRMVTVSIEYHDE
jgi:hypothetical protein